MKTTAQTRAESYQLTKPTIGSKEKAIFDLLNERQPLTAWEISDILNRPVYQVRPRLTELETKKKIRSGGKKFQERTQRKEALYWVLNDGQLRLI